MAFLSPYWHRVASQRLALRPETTVQRQSFRGEDWFVLGDPYRNQFYRFRPAIHEFIARLDGRRTVGEIWEDLLEEMPEQAPGQDDVIAALRRLSAGSLLQGDTPLSSTELESRAQEQRGREFRSRLTNIFFLRFTLWDPDVFLKRTRWVGRAIFSWPGFVIWVGFVIAALVTVADQFDRLFAASSGILSLGNLPWLYASWAILKLLHEMGHAYACRRFGGEVHRMGLMLLVLMPIPFMDATTAWRFRSKWPRVVVGAAGMYIELLIAALAALVWSATPAETATHQIAYNLIFLASVSTLLFNANPLLRFDGYYILSDLLERPNLHRQSFLQLRYLLERGIFGLRSAHAPGRDVGDATFLTSFGLLSGLYRIFVLVAIILFVGTQFLAVGLLLAVYGFISYLLVPIGRFIRYLWTEPRLTTVRPRALAVTGAVFLGVLTAFSLWPAPHAFRADGVVRWQAIEVTAPTSGFVAARPILAGETVTAGEPVVILEGDEWADRERQVAARIAVARTQQQLAREEFPGQVAPLDETLAALRGRQQWIRQQRDGLTVRAPASGYWASSTPNRRTGDYIHRGATIGTLLTPRGLVFEAVVRQRHAAHLFAETEHDAIQDVTIRFPGRAHELWRVRAMEVIEAEERRLPSANLDWRAGGSVPTESQSGQEPMAEAPFFRVRLHLIPQTGSPLRHDQPGIARFALEAEPIAMQLAEWLRQRLQERDRW